MPGPLQNTQRPTWLSRLLSMFAEVRPGEAVTVVLMAVNVFCLLALYYVLKTVREALILTESGAEVKSYAAAGQALLLLAVVPAYSAVASRVNRVWLVAGVTLFFASHLLVFYGLGAMRVPVGVPFFLWLGVFNLVVVAQFWAFANDLYSSEGGKRLFPLIGLGSALGAWLGAQFASILFAALGPFRLLLVAAAGLVVCAALTVWVHEREKGRSGGAKGEAERPLGKEGAFQLIFRDRYLLLIALLLVVVNVVNTVGEFLLGSLVVQEASRLSATEGVDRGVFIGSFYGSFFAWVNLLGFLFQLLLVPRLFKYVGVNGTLFVLPLVALLSYGTLAFVPVLAVVRLMKTLENASDYSIQNTTRHALFLPTSREAKYKAKQAIDSFFWRAGDLLQAGIVFLGTRFAFGGRDYAMLNLLFVGVWLVIVAEIAREYRTRVPAQSARALA
ncbi:MAG: translocase [Acidobacteria bacterium]|nr:MAG: translocase [Acidobacteriota bacterium]